MNRFRGETSTMTALVSPRQQRATHLYGNCLDLTGDTKDRGVVIRIAIDDVSLVAVLVDAPYSCQAGADPSFFFAVGSISDFPDEIHPPGDENANPEKIRCDHSS